MDIRVHDDEPRTYRAAVTYLDVSGAPQFIVSHLDVIGESRWREELERLRVDRERTQRIARTGTWRLDMTTAEVRWSPEMYVITG